MKRDEVEKLLGGYATNSLTDSEREQLFVAALADQVLFDALANEQPLRELLDDPIARARLLRSLGPARESAPAGFSIWRRKSAWVLAGSFVAAALVVVVVSRPGAAPLSKAMPGMKAQMASDTLPGFPAPAPGATPEVKRTDKHGVAASDEKNKRQAMVARNEERTPPPIVLSEALRQTRPVAEGPAPPSPLEASSNAQSNATDALQNNASPKLSARAIFRSSFAPAADNRRQNLMSMRGAQQSANQEPANLGGYKQTARGPQQSMEAGIPQAQNGALATAKLGLRYSIVKRDVNGVYSEVDPAAIFTAGDSVRLNFESNESGYLSVSVRTSGGGREPLFSRAVTAGTNYTVPGEGDLRFDEQSAEKTIFVVFSRQPEIPAETLSPAAGLLTEKVKDRETAVYVVDSDAQLRIAFQIVLSRR